MTRPRHATPDHVLRDAHLSREEKIAKLRQMAYDARELDVATEEGMEGPPSDLPRILEALAELDAEDESSGAKQ